LRAFDSVILNEAKFCKSSIEADSSQFTWGKWKFAQIPIEFYGKHCAAFSFYLADISEFLFKPLNDADFKRSVGRRNQSRSRVLANLSSKKEPPTKCFGFSRQISRKKLN